MRPGLRAQCGAPGIGRHSPYQLAGVRRPQRKPGFATIRRRRLMAPVSWGPALRSIVARVEASDVRELEVRAEGLSIKLRRDNGSAAAPSGTAAAGPAIETS